MPESLDRTDRRILNVLQHDASLSAAEVADRVGLSQSPCWRRITRMAKSGLIERRVALLDRQALGLTLRMFVHIKLDRATTESMAAFEQSVAELPEVMECYTILGEVDYLLVVVAKDIEAFEQFFRDRLLRIPGVQGTRTNMVLSEVKRSTALPLEAL